MSDRRYLKRRGESWYYQRAVPTPIRTRWHGPSPVIESLGTRDLTEAQSLRWKVNAKFQAEFDKLAGFKFMRMTPAEVEAAAREEYHACLRMLNETEADEEWLTSRAALFRRQLDLADPTKDHPAIAAEFPDLAPSHGLSRGRADRITDLHYAKLRARLAAVEGRLRGLAGIPSEEPPAFGRQPINLTTLTPVGAPKRPSKGGPKFADVAARFIAEKQRDPVAALTAQTVGQYEAAFRLFDSFANQPALGDVDRRLASEFLDSIAKLDPHWGRSPQTKKRSFKEIKAAYGNGPRGLTNKTINRFAMALGMVWRFAEDRDGYEGGNPWIRQSRAGGTRRGGGKQKKRAFTPEELKKLLQQQPVAAPNVHDVESALPWLTLIGAYSGMRLNEICSLTVDDVKLRGDVWFFDIAEAKTKAGIRCVPVHSRILQAGFLNYRKRLRRGQLFPGLKPGGPDGKLSWYVSKRFTEVRREFGIKDLSGVTGRDVVDFHSLRGPQVCAHPRARGR
jgi:integrase